MLSVYALEQEDGKSSPENQTVSTIAKHTPEYDDFIKSSINKMLNREDEVPAGMENTIGNNPAGRRNNRLFYKKVRVYLTTFSIFSIHIGALFGLSHLSRRFV